MVRDHCEPLPKKKLVQSTRAPEHRKGFFPSLCITLFSIRQSPRYTDNRKSVLFQYPAFIANSEPKRHRLVLYPPRKKKVSGICWRWKFSTATSPSCVQRQNGSLSLSYTVHIELRCCHFCEIWKKLAVVLQGYYNGLKSSFGIRIFHFHDGIDLFGGGLNAILWYKVFKVFDFLTFSRSYSCWFWCNIGWAFSKDFSKTDCAFPNQECTQWCHLVTPKCEDDL